MLTTKGNWENGEALLLGSKKPQGGRNHYIGLVIEVCLFFLVFCFCGCVIFQLFFFFFCVLFIVCGFLCNL
jgi:hypothetical protein